MVCFVVGTGVVARDPCHLKQPNAAVINALVLPVFCLVVHFMILTMILT